MEGHCLPLLSSVEYGSFLDYSPKGTSEKSQRSRNICHQIKLDGPGPVQGSSERLIEYAVRRLFEEMTRELAELLPATATFVPMPRSAPFPPASKGGQNVLWVTRRICEALQAMHLGAGWMPCLERVVAVPKSAYAGPGGRPSPQRHYDSFRVNKLLAPTQRVVVVDDVITKGATAIAAASRIKEAMPDVEVSVFALLRTRGLIPEVEQIVSPTIGTVQLTRGGEAQRVP